MALLTWVYIGFRRPTMKIRCDGVDPVSTENVVGRQMAIMAGGRIVAIAAVQLMAGPADIAFVGQDLQVMGDGAVCPDGTVRHLTAAGAEMTFGALDAEIMTVGAVYGAVTMELRLGLVEPCLAHGMEVAVMAACRRVAEGAIEVMADGAGRVVVQ